MFHPLIQFVRWETLFEFIVCERVQENPDNSRAMSALTFLLFKC